jgi:hypothetical protein
MAFKARREHQTKKIFDDNKREQQTLKTKKATQKFSGGAFLTAFTGLYFFGQNTCYSQAQKTKFAILFQGFKDLSSCKLTTKKPRRCLRRRFPATHANLLFFGQKTGGRQSENSTLQYCYRRK